MEKEEACLLPFIKQGHSQTKEQTDAKGLGDFAPFLLVVYMSPSLLAQVEAWVLLILASLSLAQGRALERHGGNVHESKIHRGRGRAGTFCVCPHIAAKTRERRKLKMLPTQAGALCRPEEETEAARLPVCLAAWKGGYP